jgi:mRNA interferase MazF
LVTIALQGDYGKPHPAIVIQSDYFADHASVTILPVTSELRQAPLFPIKVEPTIENSLKKRSQVMVDKVQTIPSEKVGGVSRTQVKANRGTADALSNETIVMFEPNESKNLYKLRNRMSSGSYFPPPVKQVEIPEAKGGFRTLGILLSQIGLA